MCHYTQDDKPSADEKADTYGEDTMPEYDEETKLLIAGEPSVQYWHRRRIFYSLKQNT